MNRLATILIVEGVTCRINLDKTVEIVKITGPDQEVVEAIQKTLEENPVTCKKDPVGLVFTFRLNLVYLPHHSSII